MTRDGQAGAAGALEPAPLESLAVAAAKVASGAALEEAVDAIVEAAAAATGAKLAGVWIVEPRGTAVPRAVAGVSAALAAEVEGTLISFEDLPAEQTMDLQN